MKILITINSYITDDKTTVKSAINYDFTYKCVVIFLHTLDVIPFKVDIMKRTEVETINIDNKEGV